MSDFICKVWGKSRIQHARPSFIMLLHLSDDLELFQLLDPADLFSCVINFIFRVLVFFVFPFFNDISHRKHVGSVEESCPGMGPSIKDE